MLKTFTDFKNSYILLVNNVRISLKAFKIIF